MKKLIVAVLLGLFVGAGVAALADEHGGGKHKHGNLQAAMEMIHHAEKRISMAQKANEFDLGGHAQKAKDLLAQAETELKAAGVNTDEDEDKDKKGKGEDEDKDDDKDNGQR